MKEFELQGDISSGFRWREKDAIDAERRNHSSRLVTTLSQDGEIRVAKNIPDATKRSQPVFDLDYEPLLASEREARRTLLLPWRKFRRDRIAANIDPLRGSCAFESGAIRRRIPGRSDGAAREGGGQLEGGPLTRSPMQRVCPP